MSDITKELDILKQLFENLSDIDKQNFLTSVSQKDIEVWGKYIHCMIKKYPLRKCAKICEINLATAFAWRHKILDALQNIMIITTL
jgi:hypothetical protein